MEDMQGSVSDVENVQSENSNNIEALQNNYPDIGTFEKFKFEGKEWTAQDLKNAILRQEDYTKKTQALAQERNKYQSYESKVKEYESNQKFVDNLDYDLEQLKNNPALLKDFLQIYPKKFHSFARHVVQDYAPQANVDLSPFEERIAAIENTFREQRIEAINSSLDKTFSELQKKYEHFDEDFAVTKAQQLLSQKKQALLEQGAPESEIRKLALTNKEWESIAKSVNDYFEGKFKAKYSERFNNQTQANKHSKDVKSGGGAVGVAPNKEGSLRQRLDRAADEMLRSMGG